MRELWERSYAVRDPSGMSAAMKGEDVLQFIGAQTCYLSTENELLIFERRRPFEDWGAHPESGWLTFLARDRQNPASLNVHQLPITSELFDRLSGAGGHSKHLFREDVFLGFYPEMRIRNFGLLRGELSIVTFSFNSDEDRQNFVPPSWCGLPISPFAVHAATRGPRAAMFAHEDVSLRWHRVDIRDKEVGVEIERRFLVDERRLPQLHDPKRIVQAYLVTDEKAPVRVRLTDADTEHALVTVKGERRGTRRLEYQGLIPRGIGEAFVAACEHVVVKDRYTEKLDGLFWEIDKFLADNAPLVIAEVEVLGAEDEKRLMDARPPEYCTEEIVTSRYNNEVLAEFPFGIYGPDIEGKE